jgi:hypothetical protein
MTKPPATRRAPPPAVEVAGAEGLPRLNVVGEVAAYLLRAAGGECTLWPPVIWGWKRKRGKRRKRKRGKRGREGGAKPQR